MAKQTWTYTGTLKALEVVEEITTCDCCGKANLKCTVAMETEEGDIVYFGRTCARRNSGKTQKTITKEIVSRKMEIQEKMRNELKSTDAWKACEARRTLAIQSKVSPGLEFKEFCKVETAAVEAKRTEIEKKYNQRLMFV